jgi:protein gp37
MANRLKGRYGYPKDDPFRVTFHPDRLEEPGKWRKPQRIFVCSMGDLFHKNVKIEWIDQVISEITYDYEHTFLILTKRPLIALNYFNNSFPVTQDEVLPNLWIGVSIEDQKTADERIPILLQIPAAKRFVSVEPMLGPVDIKWAISRNRLDIGAGFLERGMFSPGMETLRPLDWVIAGGETGPGARPMHPDWVRSLRNQCQAAGVPFFFKHWGEYKEFIYAPTGEKILLRVGKEKAGHLLDGKEYREFPK